MEDQRQGAENADNQQQLRHDIKNQLSNIYLSVEQLKYEIPEISADCLLYLDTISSSAQHINNLINNLE